MPKVRYTDDDLRAAVANSKSFAEALRKLGLRPAGHNRRTLWRLIERLEIPTDHLDRNWANRCERPRTATPLVEILVEGSTYNRGKLKQRLYDEGLRSRRCEMCGQGEVWRGQRMSLILDHINGCPTDNRLTNLRIVCPNCAATLDTHCGRQNRRDVAPVLCLHCGTEFTPKYATQRYCSRACGSRSKGPRDAHPERRKVTRPSYEQLISDLAAMSVLAVGRKYGVSDNAVRKWVRSYETAREDDPG